jgi:HEPN domain-containing protein
MKPKCNQTKSLDVGLPSPDLLREWLEWADQDYVAARVLLKYGTAMLWFPAVFLAHRALEKYLKAVLVSYGKRVGNKKQKGDAWGHDLEGLAQKCKGVIPESSNTSNTLTSRDFVSCLRKFAQYYSEIRYPTASRHIKIQKDEVLLSLDKIVSLIRPLARFEIENLPRTFHKMYTEHWLFDKEFTTAARKDNKYWGDF